MYEQFFYQSLTENELLQMINNPYLLDATRKRCRIELHNRQQETIEFLEL